MAEESDDTAAIAFGTDGWRATLDEFTTPRVRMVAQGVAGYLDEVGATAPVAVGYDAREGSPDFARAVADVLTGNGIPVWLPLRDCPTPTTAWMVKEHDLAGAVIITASHNPPEYNGIKYLPAGGVPALPEHTDRILDWLGEPQTDGGESIRERDFIGPYCEHCENFVDADLSGRTVAYDAMHGSGRGVTDELLARAGATVERLRCSKDATFGGTAPEPAAERVPALVDAVTEGPADLGVVNDGDADRVGVVTPERGFLDPNLFFAVMYDYLLETSAGGVVRSVSTSSIVDRVAAAHDEPVHEVPVGFKWVAAAMQRHDALLGGEESGGFAIASHLYNKDGPLLGLLAAAADAEQAIDDRVDALLATHGEIHQGKVSVDCPDPRKEQVIEGLSSTIPDAIVGTAVDEVSSVDGFKIFLADGAWLLIRPSGTEPKMRVYAEADSPDRLERLLTAGSDLVEPLV